MKTSRKNSLSSHIFKTLKLMSRTRMIVDVECEGLVERKD